MSEPVTWQHARGHITIDRPIIAGILNVTPDSFSDGGELATVDKAVERAREMVAHGADLLDVGGESTRPQGAKPVGADEELRRVIPVVRAISAAMPDVPISIDTTKSVVAEQALAEGAAIVNDVSGFRLDGAMPALCASSGAGVILMHSRGGISDMATFAHADYESVVDDVISELRERLDAARAAGVGDGAIVLDPGIGFAKRSEQSLSILSELSRVVALGHPVMVGVSRKRFVGELTGEAEPARRGAGTLAANVVALTRGARLFRVHDVRASRQALDVAWAIQRAGVGDVVSSGRS
jgi:dihydropteroate synthase